MATSVMGFLYYFRRAASLMMDDERWMINEAEPRGLHLHLRRAGARTFGVPWAWGHARQYYRAILQAPLGTVPSNYSPYR